MSRPYDKEVKTKVLAGWDETLTVKENAERLGMNPQRVASYACRWKLVYKRVQPRSRIRTDYDKIGLDRRVIVELCAVLRRRATTPNLTDTVSSPER